MTLRLVNKQRFFQKLRAIVPKVEHAALAANLQTATTMVGLAKRLAPHEDGTLQDSIRFSRSRSPTGYIVEAGGPTTTRPVRAGADASYDYAVGQELGTQKMPANPFFYPSFRVAKKGHRGRMTRAIRRAVKEAGF